MKKHIFRAAIIFLACDLANLSGDAFGRGFGGFHGGGGFGGYHGGGFSGGYDRGSFGGGSFDRGGYGGGGGFDRGSYGGGSFDRGSSGGGSFDRGSYSAGGFDRSGEFGSVNRGELNGFLGLPTDGGMHAGSSGFAASSEGAAAWRGGASAHAYAGAGGADVAHVSAGARGAAVGPNGAVAGGRYAGATAIRGPEGNTFVHTSAAGYGTRAWSPTYCHAQAVAGRGWFATSGIYHGAWCDAHPWAWHPAAWTAAAWTAAAWNTAAWSDAAAWVGAAPNYYAYNYGTDINYQDGNVYYSGQLAGTSQQYYQEAASLADSGAAAPQEDNGQWLTLGVFGLMPSGQKTPDMVFQLAVNKQGVIRGNYFDQVTQTNLPVTGQVDKQNQRVAWSVGSGKGIVVETGLYNLTQDDSTALVHYGPDKTQQELLVRMQQPSPDETASTSGE